MFIDYQEIVIKRYKEIKAKGDLPNNLAHLTPANLRNECLNICRDRFIENEDILRTFFGSAQDQPTTFRLIRGIDIERFQPLINFLKESTSATNSNNIELLAWLIDFTPRPYSKWEIESRLNKPEITSDPPGEEETGPKPPVDTTLGGRENPGEDTSQSEPEVVIILPPPPKKPWFKRNIKQTALSLMAATTLCGGTYMVAYNGSQGCMYWTGDRYKSVPCQEKVEGATVLALDSAKLLNFRKINIPDTLTISSINNLWYTKITVDSAEFYTGSGFHPLFPEKRLKPVTPYILNKYVLNK
ncbi:hypothetical protein ACR78F_10415 [Sphingobacterium spiritivorum]|uniref:hypothetical protein n=1 Tax=Sphingobacterium spiritivorum TaxID=258 RepID=UPI003DA67440